MKDTEIAKLEYQIECNIRRIGRNTLRSTN